MTSGTSTKPGGAARADRLRQALRENLKRRKAQAKARGREAQAKPHDSAGFGREIVPDKPKG